MSLTPIGSPAPLGSRLADLKSARAEVSEDQSAPGRPAPTDSATLSDTTRLTSRLRGLQRTTEALQYGLSLTQTASQALARVQSELPALEEAVRDAADDRYQAALERIDSTIGNATFDGESLFGRRIELAVGPDERMPVEFPSLSVRELSAGPREGVNLDAAQYRLPQIAAFAESVDLAQRTVSDLDSRLTRGLRELEVATRNVVSASTGAGDLVAAALEMRSNATALKAALRASAMQSRTDDAVLELLK